AALLGQVDAALHAGVMEAPGDLRLPAEALEQARVGEQHGVGRLQHHGGPGDGVAGLVGLGVGALAQGLEDLVVVDAATRLVAHVSSGPCGRATAARSPREWADPRSRTPLRR